MYFVIGDSHVRSFSYSEIVFPVFVAPGKQLLLNTDEQCDLTFKLLMPVVDLPPKSATLVLVIGEPSLREYLSTESRIDPSIYSKTFIQNLSKLANQLRLASNRKIIVLPPIPRQDKIYGYLWLKIIKEMSLHENSMALIFNTVVGGGGVLLEEYVGDFIHANEKIADVVLCRIAQSKLVSSNKYRWSYQYSIIDSCKIWGGVPISLLRYEGKSPRNWGRILEKSNDMAAVCNYLNRCVGFYQSLGTASSGVHVETYDEGYIAFSINACKSFVSPSELAKRRFAFLKKIYKSNVEVLDSGCPDNFAPKLNMIMITTDISILLERGNYYCKIFCILSTEQKLDLEKKEEWGGLTAYRFGSLWLVMHVSNRLERIALIIIASLFKFQNSIKKQGLLKRILK